MHVIVCIVRNTTYQEIKTGNMFYNLIYDNYLMKTSLRWRFLQTRPVSWCGTRFGNAAGMWRNESINRADVSRFPPIVCWW